LLTASVVLGPTGAAADVAPPPTVQITLDRDMVAVMIGEKFSFTTTVTAPTTTVSGLVAHLNIVALEPDTYVDPEDWSDARTQHLPPIPAGGQLRLPWTVQAVNDGPFIIYVALAGAEAGQAVTAGPGLRAEVREAHVIDPSGVLPIAAGVPAALTIGLVGARVRLRRRN
jgi:hypothetical protein